MSSSYIYDLICLIFYFIAVESIKYQISNLKYRQERESAYLSPSAGATGQQAGRQADRQAESIPIAGTKRATITSTAPIPLNLIVFCSIRTSLIIVHSQLALALDEAPYPHQSEQAKSNIIGILCTINRDGKTTFRLQGDGYRMERNPTDWKRKIRSVGN